MKRFAQLFTALDQTTKTTRKTAALSAYFGDAPEADRLWTIALLSGRRPKRTITANRLAEWAAEVAGLPMWLFRESYDKVGDLAETIHLVLPDPTREADRSLSEWIGDIRALAKADEAEKKAAILDAWDRLGGAERFVFNKLITGGFRVGVSQKLMTRALSQATGIEEAELAHRIMGEWSPESVSYQSLIVAPDPGADLSRPYPFCLAHGVDTAPGYDTGTGPAVLGPAEDWLAEWKWDGIRGQLILRGGGHYLWSRGEELMTDRFPEFARAGDFLPDGTVIDGEILAWDHTAGRPMGFSALQKRIGRKTVPKKLLSEAPAILYAYDLLEEAGRDIRARPFAERRARLEELVSPLPADAPVLLSPTVSADDWEGLAEIRSGAREAQAEGLMLKRKDSPYHVGRKKGDWWKWKLDPLSIDAVMVYAQAGHGRRANLYTDFTFAVWKGNDLVPFTKAYSGLTDAEFRKITHWVRRNTLARFGPVRQVPPEQVFEIGFEGIRESTRHKSGVSLRFPRMLRWRQDKDVSEADTHDTLMQMLAQYG
ncbi:ATP-dependent DNA ligase [Jannaschia aquimarina]|uniref:DNA ligase (ATP) n=1 Tax=Jannaschia aquimarina TaxID=935700 RepID=A0A0D1EJP0_9RHOB|nr:ATP-dependent DNA ligase [Jannaschia aquimarina]KIT16015.1 putative ATP-dependent DNA ligase YkoU [Jannaschia aquimarina]SNT00124.1 DNA ligase-1 [Jannaschia aquimarina]